MWLRLHLPMFWFNVGLFTLMKMDSLMVLALPWSSLPMMLKLVSVMLCPVCCTCTWMTEVLLASFSKGPCCFPYVLLIAGYVIALETVDNTALLFFRVQVLWFHEDLFYCCIAFEMYLYTILTTHVLETSPFVYGITTCPIVELGLELVVVVFVFGCCLFMFGCCCFPLFMFAAPSCW